MAYTSFRITSSIDASGTHTDILTGYTLRDFKCPYTIANRNLEVLLYDTPGIYKPLLDRSRSTYKCSYIIGFGHLEVYLHNGT